jgi:iron complex transport system substrate-binding protein
MTRKKNTAMIMIPPGRRPTALAAVFLSVSLVFTLATSASAQDIRTVEADNGAIEVPSDPQRVAAIGYASLPYIDLGGEPLGVTTMRASALNLLPEDQRAIFNSATNLGPSGGEVDLEKLASLQPDLILANMPNGDFEQIRAQLEAIAPTVFYGLGADWKDLADGFAEASNLADSLDQQKQEFANRVANIQETYRDIIEDTAFVTLDRYGASDPGTFVITHIGCVEIAQDEVGLNLPPHEEGNNGVTQSFEQIGELSNYDVILYPVDAQGQPTEPFAPVVATNAWNLLPAVNSGRALGVFCPGNNSYGSVVRYLDSLDSALATLPTNE